MADTKRINPNSNKDVIGIADPEADPGLETRQRYFFLSLFFFSLPSFSPTLTPTGWRGTRCIQELIHCVGYDEKLPWNDRNLYVIIFFMNM